MSSSDATYQDSPKHAPNISFETQATPLCPQLVSNLVLPLPPSPSSSSSSSSPPPSPPPQPPPQQQTKVQDANISPQASSDEVLVHTPLIHLEDEEIPLVIEGDILEIDEDQDDISTKDLALIYRTRKENRGPPPGATRVLKRVRVRKQDSTSKRRSKKKTLRVQLQKQDRIEEEMAQFRGKGKAKESSKPGRRYIPTDPVLGSRPPSSLRFSESCYHEEDLEDDDSVTLPRNLEASTEYSLDAPMDRTPSSVS